MNGVRYISTFSRLGKRISDLSRISSLMKTIGSPEKQLKFIHIAGTNGKGSMAKMFSCILEDAGYKTGMFTSPYIVEFSDRIQINGQNIPYETLNDIMEELYPKLEAHPMRGEFSQFEVTQAAAFLYFLRENCDVVVLETGLGGLLDCTNVIEAPLVSVIGSVSYDHTAILGETIREIAFQKAGIIKPGCPAVLSFGNCPEVVEVMQKRAGECKSRLTVPDKNWLEVISCGIDGCDFRYKGELYKTSMGGLHQISNAAAVIEAMEFVKDTLPVNRENIASGIARAKLFGRVEVLSKDPLVILDGAHNPDGTSALAKALSGISDKKITALIGMHKDKNALEAVKNLIPYVEKFVTVSGFSDRDIPAGELADIITKAGGRAYEAENEICLEIKRLLKNDPGKVLVICGSLYLVSYVKNNL